LDDGSSRRAPLPGPFSATLNQLSFHREVWEAELESGDRWGSSPITEKANNLTQTRAGVRVQVSSHERGKEDGAEHQPDLRTMAALTRTLMRDMACVPDHDVHGFQGNVIAKSAHNLRPLL
jgi:hypothetical protein